MQNDFFNGPGHQMRRDFFNGPGREKKEYIFQTDRAGSTEKKWVFQRPGWATKKENE